MDDMICERCGNKMHAYEREIKDYTGAVIRKETYMQCPYCIIHYSKEKYNQREYKIASYFGMFLSALIIIGTLVPFAKTLGASYNLFKISIPEGCCCLIAGLAAFMFLYKEAPIGAVFSFICALVFSSAGIGYTPEAEKLFNAIGTTPPIERTAGFYMIIVSSLLGLATSLYCHVRKKQS
jgi:hypothetical protein